MTQYRKSNGRTGALSSIRKHRDIIFVSIYFAFATVSRRQSRFKVAQTVRGHAQKVFKARDSCEEVNMPCCQESEAYNRAS